MLKNALDQPESVSLISAISQEQLKQSVRYFVCWYKLKEGKSWFENLLLDLNKNYLDQSDGRILKTIIFKEKWGKSARILRKVDGEKKFCCGVVVNVMG